MIKILQFGEGNFLRTFVDLYFDTLNREGGEYAVNIVKPIAFGSLDAFRSSNNKYNVVLRGVKDGEAVEKVYKVDVLDSVIDPFSDRNAYNALALDEELKIIVSNTTEAGIQFCADDAFDRFENVTYPAKLTKFLYSRYCAGLSGVYILPVELIDNNADNLYKCVDSYIKLWNLPKEFKKWNDTENFYCNTLVDRIVSGNPKDEATRMHVNEVVGYNDPLVSIGEPFGLWAIEDKGNIRDYIKDGIHNIEVVITKDIGYYKKRKVRVLNGSHTNLVCAGLLQGAETVYDCMVDKKLSRFVDDTLKDEIIPFVSSDIEATTKFADDVKERFLNPYLNHQLLSISLNSVSKWKARVLPSFSDYYKHYGKIASNLTEGFSYLVALYLRIEKAGDIYEVDLGDRRVRFLDDICYLEYFINGGTVRSFMSDEKIWGEDLSRYEGFVEAVEKKASEINKNEN